MWDDVRPYYGLFLEEPDAADAAAFARFLAAFERELGVQNIEYEAKRGSGRLGPVRRRGDAGRDVGAVGPRPPGRRPAAPRSSTSGPCLIGDVKFRATMPVIREV